jgi:putative PIN family toxin of toxin-antitoxin system
MAIRTVIDANVLASALSGNSKYHWLIELLLEEQIELFVTNEILLEYKETLKTKYSESVAADLLLALNELPAVQNTPVYFRWNLIVHPNLNKLVDCYVASNAEYLISQDTQMSVLGSIDLPRVNVVSIEEFAAVIAGGSGSDGWV